jgi:putative SOS response-associated peptidase YedK
VWKSHAGERVKTCTTITCEANDIIGAIHDRMPVILAEVPRRGAFNAG